MKKLHIQTSGQPVVQINRDANKAEQLVYIAVANKPISYPHGKSKVAYIGTTKNGVARIASSAATKSKQLMSKPYGIKSLEFFVVTCTPKKNLKSWHKLERALLLTFREVFGSIPKGNTQGKGMKWTNEEDYFTGSRLKTVINKYSK